MLRDKSTQFRERNGGNSMMRMIGGLVAVVLASVGLAGPSGAQGYPNRIVHLVVPYSAGGASDIMGRALGQKLSELWGQPVIIENKPGGTTTIGAEYVARSAPDGYTLLLAPPPFVITQHTYPNLSYDTRKSFAPISLVAYYPLIVVVPPDLPVSSLKELVDYLRAHPHATYPSPGAGTTPHLMGELLAQREKLELIHVPYRSGGQGVTDLMAGRLTFYAGVPTEVIPQIADGKLKPLAVLAPVRSALLPEVPTSAEAGYPYLLSQSWSSVVAPAHTPTEIIKKISADIAKVIQNPSLRETLTKQGAVFVGSTPEELAKFYEEEHERYGPLVKSIGLKAE
jgi:tripartite-type tricarboxylate transporter receptor subunit TctC